ncbi:MAG: CYTH domain-containing protein [Desulfuromonas sp.]|nr:CYTH domain-containing protein [Desulfuromonas sp.]
MGIEIERKFLLKSDQWRQQTKSRSRFVQGYLSTVAERTVRVRVVAEQGWLTIKGKNDGARRSEYEYPIPVDEALEMLHNLCEQPLIDKWRHLLELDGKLWEIDEFLGDNAGLIVAEIELDDEDERFTRPAWLGDEVTSDPRYFNSSLIATPYGRW